MRLLCPHELLLLVPSLNENFNFLYCGILFPCKAGVILDSNWEFAEQKRIDILVSFRIKRLFCVIRFLRKSEEDSCVGSKLS